MKGSCYNPQLSSAAIATENARVLQREESVDFWTNS